MLPSLWNNDDNWVNHLNINSGISMSEDDKQITISVSLPGINPKDVDANYDEDYIRIKAEGEQSFAYRMATPEDIDTNIEPEATCKHGVMTIKFAKSPKAQPKKITVKSV